MSSFLSLLSSFGAWSWFILAALLITLETLLPGALFLWFGIAAVLVGLLALAIGISWPWQVFAFAVFAVATVFWVRRYAGPEVALSDLPDLNARGQQYVGRSLMVAEAIQNGRGKVRVGDTLWQAEGPDLPIGAWVKVTAARGTILIVDRAPA
ncbi:MAG TPA: NfeD family protein [Hyphomicrobiaceae bacterium]|nr:NfeD family protein [Hyphomicrobiaceae bacterium]